jgi:PAS domain S-box-containing protein
MELKSLEDLEKYITILIVDNNVKVRVELKKTFERMGYLTVWAVAKAEDAYKYLPMTNILITDYLLPNGRNGIELAIEARKRFGERIQTIIFSGDDKYFSVIRKKCQKAKVTACFHKPIEPSYLKLWMKELGKRIWMQQIIDNSPDEVLIRDKDGTILFLSKEKEKIFGVNLIGDKFDLRIEKKDLKLYDNYPGNKAFKRKSIVRTEWNYITRGDIQQHKIHQSEQCADLVAAPLYDRQNEPRAIIEITRDITIRKNAELIINKMQEEIEWEKRSEIFIQGFDKLGIPRARLYLLDEKKKLFRLIKYYGNYGNLFDLGSPPMEFKIEGHKSSKLIIENKHSIYCKRDKINHNRPYEKDSIAKNLYIVGKNNIEYFDKFKLDEWIDIPLIVSRNIIGKVTIDGWKEKDGPDGFDVEVLERYCASAGQMIFDARTRRAIEQRQKTEEAILEISREITNLTKRDKLLYTAVKLACQTMGTRDCSMFLIDKESNSLKRVQSYGINTLSEEIINFPEEHFFLGYNITGYMFQKNKNNYRNDLNKLVNRTKRVKNKVNENDFQSILPIKYYEEVFGEEIQNCIFAPLRVGNQKIGLLRAMNKLRFNDFGERDFNDQDLEMFQLLAGQIAVAIQNTKLFEQTQTAEMQANEARDRFKRLFEKSPDGIVIIDPNGANGTSLIVDCNEAFCKMNGYSYMQLINQDIDILNQVNNIKKTISRKKYFSRLEKESQITEEVIHTRKNGTELAVETSICLIKINGKKNILCIDRDITESRRLRDIAQTVAHLTVLGDFKETLAKVVEGTKKRIGCDVVTLYTYDEIKRSLRLPPEFAGTLYFSDRIQRKKILESNSVVYKMLNMKIPYLVPDTNKDVYFENTRFTREEKIKSLIAIPLAVIEQKVGVMFVAYRTSHEFVDNELKNIKLFADQAAVAICNAQLFEEINSKRKALENSIDKELLRKFSMIGSVINHRIGNSVGTIRLRLNRLLEKKEMFDDKVVSDLLTMKECAEKVLNARAEIREKGEKLLFSASTEMKFSDLFRSIMQNEEFNTNTNVNIIIDDKVKMLPSIFANNDLLTEGVFFELIRNAIKSMPNGGNVEIGGAIKENNIEIIVTDHGCGIAEKDLDIIFQEGINKWPIITGKHSSGKGLSYMKTILEFYRGKIEVKSKIGKGSSFIVTMPIYSQAI